MKLIIVRHGETEANVKKILQGKEDGKLTQKGIEQAKQVGKMLKDKSKIDAVFCSPLGRCVETLNNILEECPIENDIFMSNLIEERDFGEYTGVAYDLVNWDEINLGDKVSTEMGVESQGKLEKRVELFLEDLKLEEEKETVLIISHGGPILAMVNRLSKQNLTYPETKIENAQIIELDYKTELEF